MTDVNAVAATTRKPAVTAIDALVGGSSPSSAPSSATSSAQTEFAALVKRHTSRLSAEGVSTEIGQTLVNDLDRSGSAATTQGRDTAREAEASQERSRAETEDEDRVQASDEPDEEEREDQAAAAETPDRAAARRSAARDAADAANDAAPTIAPVVPGLTAAVTPAAAPPPETTGSARGAVPVASTPTPTSETASPSLGSASVPPATDPAAAALAGQQAAATGTTAPPQDAQSQTAAAAPTSPQQAQGVAPRTAAAGVQAPAAEAEAPPPSLTQPSAKAQEQAAQLARQVEGEAGADTRIRVASSTTATDARPSQAPVQPQSVQPNQATSQDFQSGGQSGHGGFGNPANTTPNAVAQARAALLTPDASGATGTTGGPPAQAGFEAQLLAQQANVQAGPGRQVLPGGTPSGGPTAGSPAGGGLSGPSSQTTGAASATASAPALPPAGSETMPGASVPGQGASQTQTASRTPEATPTPRQPTPEAQRVMDQVKVNIAKAIDRGVDRISIQLTPKALGRIEVKMEISSGQVQATVLADNQQTLDMLRSDQRGLEKALQDAGLKTDSGSLSFGLREGSQNSTFAQNEGRGSRGARGVSQTGRDTETADPTLLAEETGRASRAAARGGVDLQV